MTLILTLRKRLLLFLFITIIGFFMSAVLSAVLLWKFSADSTPVMRINTLFQDIFVFIIPAVITALLCTRQPAELLGLKQRLPSVALWFGLAIVVVMIPAINFTTWLNLHVPVSEEVRAGIQTLEDNAAAAVSVLMGPHDIPNLIVSMLIVAVAAGFSEELFFRGTLQRLLTTGGMNHHAAIWVSAAVFSLLHMQFFGFVPRLLLGALFGYAFYWTGSIWVPALMHMFNNALYLVFQWNSYGTGETVDIDTLGVSGNLLTDIILVVVSIVLVAVGLRLMHRFRKSLAR